VALYHVRFDVVRRSKGQSAVKVAAYHAATKFSDGNETYNFRRKAKEHQGQIMLLPAGAPSWAFDPERLWRTAEEAERQANGQPARLVEFAIPREVPAEQRLAFAEAITRMWVEDGMAAQVDIHCVTATDGGEQPHAHVLLTMRRFKDGEFEKTKERAWNSMFGYRQDEKCRAMHKTMAERMNRWLDENGIAARVDHRNMRDLHEEIQPERDVPKKSVEAWKKSPDSAPAAPFRAVLEKRQARRQLKQYSAEMRRIDRALDRYEEAMPGLRTPRRDRYRPGIHWDARWTPKVGGRITDVQIRRTGGMIVLDGGRSAVIDRGDIVTQRGKITDASIATIADQAARHGWRQVELTGDPAYRNRLAAALQVRGIATTNHGPASPEAITAARDYRARANLKAMQPPAPTQAPAVASYRPSWAKGPPKPNQTETR